MEKKHSKEREREGGSRRFILSKTVLVLLLIHCPMTVELEGIKFDSRSHSSHSLYCCCVPRTPCERCLFACLFFHYHHLLLLKCGLAHEGEKQSPQSVDLTTKSHAHTNTENLICYKAFNGARLS